MQKIILLCLFIFPTWVGAQDQIRVIYRGIILSDRVGHTPLSQPLGMDIDPDGNLYIVDQGGAILRVVDK